MAKKADNLELEVKDQSVDLTPEKFEGALDSMAIIDRGNEKKTKVKFKERVALEITEDFAYHKKGDKINPHKIIAEQYILQGKAKKV